MSDAKNEFLSREDLDLRNLSQEELVLQWNAWLEQAQSTNDADADTYSHGVFVLMRAAAPSVRSRTRSRPGIGARNVRRPFQKRNC